MYYYSPDQYLIAVAVLRALVHNGFYTEVSSRVFANNNETKLLRDPLMAAPTIVISLG